MRIISLNVNGIRAAARKGLYDWLPKQNADFVCLQEVRASADQIDDPMYHPDGYECHYEEAQKKGYSGVAVYSRRRPDAVIRGAGLPEFDAEGRYLELQIENLSVVSFYLPSGTSGGERQAFKYHCMDFFDKKFRKMMASGRDVVICGDWNIAHREIDLKNWRGNRKNSGFLPEERAWLDKLYDKIGMVDAFRQFDPAEDCYTWWSNRGQAWAKNVGWRLDLQVTTPDIASTVTRAKIFTADRFSDHAPLTMDYEYALKTRRIPRRRKT
ncbi:MAG: exodeoxyribonuclease III [Gammaproteobacteria bacterium]|nr:exodeoxyribonuclease III [Gammaproteobacteria bacterium]